MLNIDYTKINTTAEVHTTLGIFPIEVVPKPFFDPNKKIVAK
jgi:hypothetical protein